MGSLAVAVGKKGGNMFNAVFSMLKELHHRGSDAFGVASSGETVVVRNIMKLKDEKVASSSLIGYGLAKYSGRDVAQPIQRQDFSLAVNGRFYPSPPEGEPTHLADVIEMQGVQVDHVIQKFNGAYTFACTAAKGVVLGRDALGADPLYFGENSSLWAAASERKALQAIGIRKTTSFPPGHVVFMNGKGASFKSIKRLNQPPIRTTKMRVAAKQLQSTLLQSVKEQLSDLQEVAVAFSGGVDSSLIARLAEKCGVKVCLISVGLAGCSGTSFAQHAARALNLNLHSVSFSSDDLEQILPKVQWLIEDNNPLDICIAVPFFWIAQQADQFGYRVLLSGQGADESFGGYYRYLEEYATHGAIGLQRRLLHDIIACSESGFPRDNKVSACHKIELRNPLVSWRVVQLALSFPIELKLNSPTDPLRKNVLRETATLVEVPEFIAKRPKQAIQYSTGVMRAIRKLARKHGLTIRKYMQMCSSEESGDRDARWVGQL